MHCSARYSPATFHGRQRDFAPCVQEHFLRRKGAILAAIDAYASGAAAVGAEERAMDSSSPAADGVPEPDAGASQSSEAEAAQGSDAVAAAGGGAPAGDAASSPPASGPGMDPGQHAAGPAAAAAAGSAAGDRPADAGAGSSSQGFRILLQQLKPRLEATIDSLQAPGHDTAE